MNADRATGLLALTVAGVYYYFASEIQRSLLADQVGADGLPKSYAIAVGALGILLVGQSFLARPGAPTSVKASRAAGPLSHAYAIGLLGLGAAYLLLISSLGYFFTVSLLLAAIALYCGAAFDFKLVLISVAGGLFFWLAFVKLFDMELPSGTLWRWLVG